MTCGNRARHKEIYANGNAAALGVTPSYHLAAGDLEELSKPAEHGKSFWLEGQGEYTAPGCLYSIKKTETRRSKEEQEHCQAATETLTKHSAATTLPIFLSGFNQPSVCIAHNASERQNSPFASLRFICKYWMAG